MIKRLVICSLLHSNCLFKIFNSFALTLISISYSYLYAKEISLAYKWESFYIRRNIPKEDFQVWKTCYHTKLIFLHGYFCDMNCRFYLVSLTLWLECIYTIRFYELKSLIGWIFQAYIPNSWQLPLLLLSLLWYCLHSALAIVFVTVR